MRDLMAELKELRLHGMANAWADLTAQGESALASSKWLLENLLQQEHADRAMRPVSHQMNMAKLPMHRDLAGFNFSADARLIRGWPAWPSPTRHRTRYSSAGRAPARPTWPPR